MYPSNIQYHQNKKIYKVWNSGMIDYVDMPRSSAEHLPQEGISFIFAHR